MGYGIWNRIHYTLCQGDSLLKRNARTRPGKWEEREKKTVKLAQRQVRPHFHTALGHDQGHLPIPQAHPLSS